MRTSWRLVLGPFQSSQSYMFQPLVHQSKTIMFQISVLQSNTLDYQVARSSQSKHLSNHQNRHPSRVHPSKAFMSPLQVLQSNTLHLLLTGSILPSFLSKSKISKSMTSIASGSIPMFHALFPKLLYLKRTLPILPNPLNNFPHLPGLHHPLSQGGISFSTYLTNMSSVSMLTIFLPQTLACVTAFLLATAQHLSKNMSTISALSEASMSRTWMALNSNSATQVLIQMPGIASSRTSTIMTNLLPQLNGAGMFPSKAILLRKILCITIHLPCLIWAMWTNTSRKNWSLGHLLALFQRNYHSKPLSVLSALFQRITVKSPAPSPIAVREPLESMPGSMLMFIVAAIGKFVSHLLNILLQASPRSELKTQVVKSSSSKSIYPGIIDSGWSVLVRLHSLLFDGGMNSTSTAPLDLAIAQPASVLREAATPFPGSSEHKFLLHPENKTRARTVPVAASVNAGTITRIPTVMTSLGLPPRNQPPTFSPCSSPSSRSWASNPPPPRATWSHLPMSWLLWESSLTSPRTLYHCHKRSLMFTSPPSSVSSPKISSPTRTSSPPLEFFFSVQELFTQEDSTSTSSLMQKEELLDSIKSSQLKQISGLTFTGGLKHSDIGMGFHSWNSTQREKSQSTPAQTELKTSDPSGDSTLSPTSSSKPSSQMRCNPGTFRILNYSLIWLLLVFGLVSGLASPSREELTMKPPRNSSSLVDLGVTKDYKWQEPSVPSNIDQTSNGFLPEFLRQKICLQITPLDGPPRNRSSGNLQNLVGLLQSKPLFPNLLLNGNPFNGSNVPGVQRGQADPNLADLWFQAQKFQQAAWAQSTHRAISSQQKMYLSFCGLFKIPPLPCNGDQLVLYSTWLVSAGKINTHGSLCQYLSAVSTFCKQNGTECPTPSQHWFLWQTTQGIKRTLKTPPRQSKPITIPILSNLLTTKILHDSWVSYALLETMKSLTTVLFFSMVRSSTLIPASPGLGDPERQLTWGRLRRLGDTGVICSVILDKTIQSRERIHHVTLASRPGSIFCPVAALDTMMSIRGRENCLDSNLVFQVPDDAGRWRPLSKYEYRAWLVHRFTEMGVDPATHLIHGFRHGSLNLCFKLEKNLQLIKIASNHLSSAVFTYSNIPAADRFGVAQKMMAAMPDCPK